MKNSDDVWSLNLDAGKAATQALKGGSRSLGIPCPQKNELGHKCFACERAYALFQTNRPEDSILARKIYAKKAPMCNVEFLNERGKVYLMVLPVNVATTILEQVYNTRSWGNIAHPNPKAEDTTSGLPLILSKGKEGEYIKYSITPKIGATPAERKLSGKAVMEASYKFSSVMKDVANGRKDINFFFPRSDMAIGQKVEFKIIPNMEDHSQSPIHIGFVHFNITADEIYGRSSYSAPPGTSSTPDEFEAFAPKTEPSDAFDDVQMDSSIDLEDELFK